MSRQMAPVTELMFGCQIFVTNLTYTTKSIHNSTQLKSTLHAHALRSQ